MEQIAIISDIHGNLEALKTVLKDIRKRNITRIFCLGDIIAKGNHSQECIKLVKKNCEIVLKGNCDEYFSSEVDLSKISKLQRDRVLWNKSKLSEKEMYYLQNLPYCFEFYLSGRLVRLFHATPNKINDFVGNVDQINRLYRQFLPSNQTISNRKADVVIYGHLHTSFIQKIYNRTLINSGSVGNAIDIFRNDEKDGNVKNTTVANYLIVSGEYDSKNRNDKISYELIDLPYNIEKELENNKDNLELSSYKEELTKGKYRDMEKIYRSFELRGINKDDV